MTVRRLPGLVREVEHPARNILIHDDPRIHVGLTEPVTERLLIHGRQVEQDASIPASAANVPPKCLDLVVTEFSAVYASKVSHALFPFDYRAVIIQGMSSAASVPACVAALAACIPVFADMAAFAPALA